MTPQQLVEWRAARAVVPLEDGWRQAGTIAAAAHNDFERYMTAKAGRRVVPGDRLRRPEDYIPKTRVVPPPLVNTTSIAAHQAAIACRYGTPGA